MRSGRKRSDERTRSESVAAPSLVRSETRFGRGALQFARVFDQNDAVGGLGDFREQRIDERRLAGRSSAGDQNVLARRNGGAENRRLLLADHTGGDIIVEREDGDRRLADGEGGRRDDWRQQPLEALARFRQFRRDARGVGVNLGADMMRDEPDDPLAVFGREARARILQPALQPIKPEPPVGIEHDLDNAFVVEPLGDLRSQRRAQHARAARDRLRIMGLCRHIRPRFSSNRALAVRSRGRLRKAEREPMQQA